jgi:hypothetical protein
MTEYNLTWNEAKEAMRRGAIVMNNSEMSHNRYQMFNSTEQGDKLICSKINGRWTIPDVPIGDLSITEWRIVELTDCDVKLVKAFVGRGLVFECELHCHTANPFLNDIEQKEQLKEFCIQKFTEQLKEDMKRQANEKLDAIREIIGHEEFDSIKKEIMAPDSKCPTLIDSYIKHLKNSRKYPHLRQYPHYEQKVNIEIKEQKMKEPKIYSFEKALSGMRYGKFYRPLIGYKGVYRLNMSGVYPILESKADGQRDWVKVTMRNCDEHILGGLMTYQYCEVENPEKKEPEKVYNELSITTDLHGLTPAVFQSAMFGEMLALGFNSEQKMKSFIKALQTFLRLKAHPLAREPSETPQPYLALNTGQGNICYIMCNEFKDKCDYLSPMFDSYPDAEKAVEDIGEKNLVEMFKVFSGVYE